MGEEEYKAKKSKRKKVFRQSQINTIDEMKGKYKSPKTAMFMSLVIPGLGQAYVGSYIRSAMYVLVEGGLALGWRHYVVTKHDRQVDRYRKFAAEHWSHRDYETKLAELTGESNFTDPELLLKALPTREQYCNSLFPSSQTEGSRSQTCKDLGPYDLSDDYRSFSFYTFLTQYETGDSGVALSVDEVLAFRENNFQDLHTFYEIIGKHNEYLMGWDDNSITVVDRDESETAVGVYITGSSDRRDEYRAMRAKATEYSRMQSIFLGGIVINHLISALDAAITARYHNKKLYETEVKWYDRIQLKSLVALNKRGPEPMVRAYLSF